MNQKKITRRDKNFTATGRGTLYIYMKASYPTLPPAARRARWSGVVELGFSSCEDDFHIGFEESVLIENGFKAGFEQNEAGRVGQCGDGRGSFRV